MLLAVPFFFGVFAMSAIEAPTTQAQDKKEDKKEKEFPPRPKGFDFKEKVTVRLASGDNKPISSERKDIGAMRFSTSKGKAFYLSTKDIGAVSISKGSEVVDSDGFVYVVESNPNTSENRLVYVTLKKK